MRYLNLSDLKSRGQVAHSVVADQTGRHAQQQGASILPAEHAGEDVLAVGHAHFVEDLVPSRIRMARAFFGSAAQMAPSASRQQPSTITSRLPSRASNELTSGSLDRVAQVRR